MADEETAVEFDRLIYEDMNKFLQLRVVVSNFRDVDYLHIRKYFLSYEGEWIPSKEGVSMPVTIDNITKLTDSMLDLCANAEGTDLFTKHFRAKFQEAPLTCDYCGCETDDPWHGSNATNRHIHACDACYIGEGISDLTGFP